MGAAQVKPQRGFQAPFPVEPNFLGNKPRGSECSGSLQEFALEAALGNGLAAPRLAPTDPDSLSPVGVHAVRGGHCPWWGLSPDPALVDP